MARPAGGAVPFESATVRPAAVLQRHIMSFFDEVRTLHCWMREPRAGAGPPTA